MVPRIFISRDVERRASKSGRFEVVPAARIARCGDTSAVIDEVADVVLRELALFESDLFEEGFKAVVVVLAPLLERVMMAASALNPHAKEQLSRVFHLGRRGRNDFEPCRRRM